MISSPVFSVSCGQPGPSPDIAGGPQSLRTKKVRPLWRGRGRNAMGLGYHGRARPGAGPPETFSLWRAFVRAGETSYPSLYTKEEEVEGFSTEKDEICQLRRYCVKKVYKKPIFHPIKWAKRQRSPRKRADISVQKICQRPISRLNGGGIRRDSAEKGRPAPERGEMKSTFA